LSYPNPFHVQSNFSSQTRVDSDAPQSASQSALTRIHRADTHFNRARASLKQAISRYSRQIRLSKQHPHSMELQSALKTDLDQLSATLDKLDHGVLRVAVFGLVSRGKSAVINALLEQKLLQTGPLHGVTQWPRSVYWSPLQDTHNPMTIELIDTPGLDEVGGESRATMAQEVAQQSDLILFVVSGDITRSEYQALVKLQEAHKPLLLVFNKIDLYPDQDRQSIDRKLQTLFRQNLEPDHPEPISSADDILMVAAEPAPLQVRIEWPDGRVTHEWESPPPQVDELRQRLMMILSREGKSLVALNALRQARESERAIARKTLQIHEDDAEDLIWKFARWKAITIAANPIVVLDLVGGAATDLVMIRSLARLYGLPMTGYEANRLWNAIVWSSGSLLLGEIGTGLILGFGKSAAAFASVFDSVGGFAAYSTTAIAQASLAGYGSYRVGKAAQMYLEQGCTWGPQGANTVIQDILNQVDTDTVIYKLRRDLEQRGKP
jgi:small GTP-binding protein